MTKIIRKCVKVNQSKKISAKKRRGRTKVKANPLTQQHQIAGLFLESSWKKIPNEVTLKLSTWKTFPLKTLCLSFNHKGRGITFLSFSLFHTKSWIVGKENHEFQIFCGAKLSLFAGRRKSFSIFLWIVQYSNCFGIWISVKCYLWIPIRRTTFQLNTTVRDLQS